MRLSSSSHCPSLVNSETTFELLSKVPGSRSWNTGWYSTSHGSKGASNPDCLFDCFFASLFIILWQLLWKTRCTCRTVDQSDGIYNNYSTVARNLWQRKLPLSSGFALGLGLVYCHKFLALCYNYNLCGARQHFTLCRTSLCEMLHFKDFL